MRRRTRSGDEQVMPYSAKGKEKKGKERKRKEKKGKERKRKEKKGKERKRKEKNRGKKALYY